MTRIVAKYTGPRNSALHRRDCLYPAAPGGEGIFGSKRRAMMRKRLLGAGVLAVLLIPFAAAGEEPTTKKSSRIVISEVIISGNRQISTEQIKAHLRIQIGDKYNPATLNNDVRELYNMHEFSDVQAVKQ